MNGHEMPTKKSNENTPLLASFPISRLEALGSSIGPREVAILVAIAELKSLSKAAAFFSLTTASLSQRLKSIELALGHTVFRRFSRGVELNSTGQAIYPTILDAAYSFAEIAETISSLAPAKITAPIVISCPKLFGELYLTPHVLEYIKCHPGTRIHLNIDNSTAPIDEQRFDILFRAHRIFPGESIPPYDFTARKVMQRPLILCSSAEYARRNERFFKDSADIGRLAVVDLKFKIDFAWQLAWSDWRLQDLRSNVIETIKVKVTQSTNSARILKDYLLANLGVSIIPRDLITEELADGRLVCPLPTHRAPDLVVHMIHHRKAVRNETRKVMEFLASRLDAAELDLNARDV